MDQDRLFTLLEKSLQYTPIVYRQTLYTTNQAQFDNKFVLEFKHSDVPDDSLLFFIPSISSNNSKDCKLVIRIPYVDGTGKYGYSDSEYDIIVEETDSTMRKAQKGDIVAYTMCIFRFQKSSNRAILCNSPLHLNATFSDLKVTNCKFVNLPEYIDPQNPSVTYTLVSTKEYNNLLKRVEKLEKRIQWGAQPPEEVAKDLPAGTIYIQVEED